MLEQELNPYAGLLDLVFLDGTVQPGSRFPWYTILELGAAESERSSRYTGSGQLTTTE